MGFLSVPDPLLRALALPRTLYVLRPGVATGLCLDLSRRLRGKGSDEVLPPPTPSLATPWTVPPVARDRSGSDPINIQSKLCGLVT